LIDINNNEHRSKRMRHEILNDRVRFLNKFKFNTYFGKLRENKFPIKKDCNNKIRSAYAKNK
jgi:hypothetical protein